MSLTGAVYRDGVKLADVEVVEFNAVVAGWHVAGIRGVPLDGEEAGSLSMGHRGVISGGVDFGEAPRANVDLEPPFGFGRGWRCRITYPGHEGPVDG